MLQIRNLRVHFGKSEILSGIHLTANRGKITGIVGRSGSGKSTLFRSILGVRELVKSYRCEGEILWDGEPLQSKKFKSNPPIQPVFQDPYSFFSPFHSILESLLEPTKIKKGILLSPSARKMALENIESYLNRFQLDGSLLNKKTKELSGGQLQRFAILRAILSGPELVLLDEPVTALDVLVQIKIVSLIKELNEKDNLGFVLVSHDLGLVKNLCDDLYILEKGKIIEFGNAKEVFMNPKENFTRALIEARNLSDL
ncbi:ABC transporter ATP-binding protein [Leptospira ilyithenensis]|uniref:ATP-binding cassette domain-containing protein n=1 Tax=Leptospira ilyithenensis TaxID=2484901 RepID=A0A4R9LN29_9LEPT|nr:ATP-binding cassette domain-containing protein [Leptospira ilyithenensis]TGN08117.1 ATP-binding cassette domain-containing protein [Leptospira ilyithenensis]